MQYICTIYFYNTTLQIIVETKTNNKHYILYILIKKNYCIKLNKYKIINNIFYFKNCFFVLNNKRLRIVII